MSTQDELNRLYREVVLDHNRNPRNFRRIASATRVAVGHNPLCGDKVTLYVDLDHDRIRDISFEATGCAISMASASMLTELVRESSLTEAQAIASAARTAFAGGSDDAPPGVLAALAGVRSYPSRVRCATLPWHTLQAALRGEGNASSERETA